MNTPLYIFDLDGTLALTGHRQHLLDNLDNPHRWRDFFAACVHDEPNEPVIHTMKELAQFNEIRIWSVRSADVRPETLNWLSKYLAPWRPIMIESILTMRPSGNTIPDDELKLGWLNALPPEDRKRLVAIFDDRDKVVRAWRNAGVACFQVAEGKF